MESRLAVARMHPPQSGLTLGEIVRRVAAELSDIDDLGNVEHALGGGLLL